MKFPFQDLGDPPPLADGVLRVLPLGGCGDVGRNMTVFEYQDSMLLVDCGVLFPEASQTGIDLILPDFSVIADRFFKVKALILTHGHEDHIGGVPFLLREHPDIQIYGSRLTCAFVREKCAEHRLSPKMHIVKEGDRVTLGEFAVDFIAITHSIPDALALRILAGHTKVLYTSDFNIDPLPVDGRVTDMAAFARFGAEGVDLLMIDSTNAEVEVPAVSEREIEPVLDMIVADAPHRVIVAAFSSHINRIQQIINVAVRNSRKVAFVGRSMLRNSTVARDLGFLRFPPGTVLSIDDVEGYPDDEVVLITTGSQGEPASALARMASRDHRFRVREGDTVVLSSSVVPGNEQAVNRVINDLTRQGVSVIDESRARVHVSGHATKHELLQIYNLVQPANVMPVHGEPRHQHANARIAHSTGVAMNSIKVVDDGVVVDVVGGKAEIVGAVPCGLVYVDGASVGSTAEVSLKDRRVLAAEGFLSVITVVDLIDRSVIAGPEVHARGFSEDPTVFTELTKLVGDELECALQRDVTDISELQRIVRKTAGTWVNKQRGRRPMIVPVVIEA